MGGGGVWRRKGAGRLAWGGDDDTQLVLVAEVSSIISGVTFSPPTYYQLGGF